MSEWGNRIVGRIFVVEKLDLDDEVWFLHHRGEKFM